mmetsp:Transcript_31274/g.37824  ORF Transcript_31274/g.37824 Transcript_31274/m.37824 type:complete len:281 (-) Transcript_31274:24-866(-)|eukprot:CAMPEP_0197864626 /NCGR_PEP_ID=MMETSP1438-20131217/42988_1 /TAXON_ID=1461541 /ORGANISM="Pterosperma sp., Strain CCMP1384" /LENGTH=280 /DNA_ID=CAMNT_0043482939 /DNA_START=63 /DNA_END=905 /DNA_ORIENTATION=-
MSPRQSQNPKDVPASPSGSDVPVSTRPSTGRSPMGAPRGGLRARFSVDEQRDETTEEFIPHPQASETPTVTGGSFQTAADGAVMDRLRGSMLVERIESPGGPDMGPVPPSQALDETSLTNTIIASSLWLQILLYHNVHFSVVWFLLNIGSTYFKGVMYGKNHDEIRTICTVLWMVAEPTRLYAGYAGNLQEKVPLLVVFMAMTFFPCIPVSAYLFIAQKAVQPFDKAVNVVMLAMLFLQLLAGGIAINKLVRSQDQKFYLQDYEQQRMALAHQPRTNTHI